MGSNAASSHGAGWLTALACAPVVPSTPSSAEDGTRTAAGKAGLRHLRVSFTALVQDAAEHGEHHPILLPPRGLLRPDHVGQGRHIDIDAEDLQVQGIAREVLVPGRAT